MFLVFYYLQKSIRKPTPFHLILLFIGLAGVYLDQSRQFMISTVLSAFLVYFIFSNYRRKWLILIPVAIALVLVAVNSAPLFDELMDITKDDLSGDNIRLLAFATFGLEFWGGPLSVVFGNGPAGQSAYGEQVTYMKETMGLFHSDVGLVGAANLYGIVTVLLFIAFYVFYIARNWKKIQPFLRMFFIALLINSPLVTIFTQNINWFVFFAMMLYLSDRDIVHYEKKLAAKRMMYAAKHME
jgi:hypothetical protein